jgi:hypothetical protein
MKKLTIALLLSPFLAAGNALAQETTDPDLLSPRERVLHMRPDLWPDWTWMREDQAVAILKGHGYDVALPLEKASAAWRGKATRNNESYYVAVNRYAYVFGHLDKESRSRRELVAMGPSTATPSDGKLATLNGPIERPVTQMAPTGLTPGRPYRTVMGETGWTWMKEGQAINLLMSKGYDRVHGLRKDDHGIWRGKALKDQVAVLVGIDVYGNTIHEPVGDGGVAQAGF